MESAEELIESTLKLAEKNNAAAVLISGKLPFPIETDIPVYQLPGNTDTFIEGFIPPESGSLHSMEKNLCREAKSYVSDIEKAASIEHVIGKMKRGIVVGISISEESVAIIFHDFSKSVLLNAMQECEERISPEVMRAAFRLCLEISEAGREGRQVGTAFLIGDHEEVMQRSHQMILNPYSGHPDDEKSILEEKNWESVKEFSLLDGVFIVSEEGVILNAGRYLDVDAKDLDINKGFGGRHVSAAAMTRDTVAIALTVSESGGTVRLFMDGKERVSIESTDRLLKNN
ncbi:DNA integrity scanning protein DisA with diadenylate cyclase activity [Methanohalophilus levihalophilus]|uniref:DNA integrity scanning protein DisA nucleotide-binding domain protein n=1 Tax=Methanohalophilus levihalophilus TaxID=1431282 RepID=UPI001AE8F97A|nr:diadenylate cyclase [Methanohalophilus levihalophilus]MBP2030875.1 DNA integrity scanning protein DisA with diadenylate cyclase activity [Methanohalophilus levihalophilus]